jgi:hypothetical protein
MAWTGWILSRCCLRCLLLVLTGTATAAEEPAYLDPDLPVEAPVEDLLMRMMLEEKLGQKNLD